ncbi:hypothetical protein P5673_016881 [Acropora cervicornis]|uniref:Uncharacterized protein n=1 Tax=Acropora cervicornis TaxID=6130 RepID=A0AAD9QFW2_ACRCE|nr:hypothetical protein P5673_016881 [Acropora cervicornis]
MVKRNRRQNRKKTQPAYSEQKLPSPNEINKNEAFVLQERKKTSESSVTHIQLHFAKDATKIVQVKLRKFKIVNAIFSGGHREVDELFCEISRQTLLGCAILYYILNILPNPGKLKAPK